MLQEALEGTVWTIRSADSTAAAWSGSMSGMVGTGASVVYHLETPWPARDVSVDVLARDDDPTSPARLHIAISDDGQTWREIADATVDRVITATRRLHDDIRCDGHVGAGHPRRS